MNTLPSNMTDEVATWLHQRGVPETPPGTTLADYYAKAMLTYDDAGTLVAVILYDPVIGHWAYVTDNPYDDDAQRHAFHVQVHFASMQYIFEQDHMEKIWTTFDPGTDGRKGWALHESLYGITPVVQEVGCPKAEITASDWARLKPVFEEQMREL